MPAHAITPSPDLVRAVFRVPITLVRGPSGSGKSRRLAGLEQGFAEAGFRTRRVEPMADTETAVFDVFNSDHDKVCTTLAACGLAEPRLWSLPAGLLSAGQRARLEIAIAIHDAKENDVIIADEFCTALDRVSAMSLCATIRRVVDQRHLHLVAASAHEDLEPMLGPKLLIDGSTGEIQTLDGQSTLDTIRYEQGTMNDYNRLSHLHYLGGQPATRTLVLRAVRESKIIGDTLAGVLIVSMPTLNGAWRKMAWGDRYSNQDKRAAALRINRELRCISRVIVEPRSRGLGVASGLVRAYLQCPQTNATEAIAAMGSVCPFFARAGMTQYTIATPPANTRLLDAIAYLGTDPSELTQHSIEDSPLLHRELMHWARSTRMLRDPQTPPHTIALMAACRLLSRPRAYAWTNQGEHDEEPRTDQ